MIDYKPYPISNWRTGFNESLEPWLLPRDSMQVLVNAHLYRGVIEKIPGFEFYAKFSYRTQVAMTGTINSSNQTFTITISGPPATTAMTIQSAVGAGLSSREIFTYSMDSVFNPVTGTYTLALSSNLGGTGTAQFNGTSTTYTVMFNTAPVTSAYNTVILQYDTSAGNPIMGIKPYYTNTGGQQILIFDTRRMGFAIPLMGGAIPAQEDSNYGVKEIPHQYYLEVDGSAMTPAFNGSTNVTFTGTLSTNIDPGTVLFTLYDASNNVLGTITDNGAGALSGSLISAGFINYSTGAYTITFSAAPAASSYMSFSVGLFGDVFTGGISNFFDVQNYMYFAFITNNVDRPFYYDGTLLRYLPTSLVPLEKITATAGVPQYDIQRCLHLDIYRERLCLENVTVDGVLQQATIYWSKPFLPLDFTDDQSLVAPTSQPIVDRFLINTDMVVRFSNSERVFRYTGDAFAPFRWDPTNNLWQTDTQYSSINYDSYGTAVGKPAITASNGVNIKRADEIIPDFTDPGRVSGQAPVPYIDQTSIGQCYGQRFDDIKEGWMCYRSAPSSSISPSDSVLAFNYLDDAYAVYSFPFSCLGLATILSVPVWGTIQDEWGNNDETWGSYSLTPNSLVDLAGDQFGNIFQLNSAYTLGGLLEGSIDSYTNADPVVFHDTNHGLSTGDPLIFQGIIDESGPSILNNTPFTVTVLSKNTFSVPVDTTLYPRYESGGNWFTTPVAMNFVTKNFNPFLDDGQLARLGYIDLLVSANNDTKMRVQFYANDELDPSYSTFYQESILQFNSTTPNNRVTQTKVWKRIYVGAVAKSHTLRFYQNYEDFTSTTLNQPISIHGMVLYFKPAGRVFN